MSRARQDPRLPIPEAQSDPASPLFYPDSYFDRLVRRLSELLWRISEIPTPDGGTDANVITKTGDYTALASDALILYNLSGNATLTLPAANALGPGRTWQIIVKRVDVSGSTLTVQRSGSDMLNGGSSTTVVAAATKTFMSNGVTEIWTI